MTILTAASTTAMATTVFLAGDSTCASYRAQRAPLTGWGQVLNKFVAPGVRVSNRAASGRSTKSFIDEGRWDKLISAVKPGDFVIIQFGHNDRSTREKMKHYTDPAGSFRDNLKKMISDVRAKKAIPLLATPTVNCIFRDGKIYDDKLVAYREAIFAVGKSENVEVADFYDVCVKNFNALGESEALKLFMYSSDIPKRKGIDRIHFNFHGAQTIVPWFVDYCKKENLSIAKCFK